jgi:hypothetical protein
MAILLLKIFHGNPTNVLENHARKRHRGTGFRREGLIVFQELSGTPLEDMNERIER